MFPSNGLILPEEVQLLHETLLLSLQSLRYSVHFPETRETRFTVLKFRDFLKKHILETRIFMDPQKERGRSNHPMLSTIPKMFCIHGAAAIFNIFLLWDE